MLLPKLKVAQTRKYCQKETFSYSQLIIHVQALHRNKITAKLENFHTTYGKTLSKYIKQYIRDSAKRKNHERSSESFYNPSAFFCPKGFCI